MKFYIAMDTDKLEWFGPTAALLERMGHTVFPIYEDGIPDGSQSLGELTALLKREYAAAFSADAVLALTPLNNSTARLVNSILHLGTPVLHEVSWDPDLGSIIEYRDEDNAAVVDVITEPVVKKWLAKVFPSQVQTKGVMQ